MANPSLKKGYLSIANEIVEILARTEIPAREMRIIWVIMRKTWGWIDGDRKKDWDWISNGKFSEFTGIDRRNCILLIKSLVNKKFILKRQKGKKNEYKINQDYEEWVVSPMTLGSVANDTTASVANDTHKRKKETNTIIVAKATKEKLSIKKKDMYDIVPVDDDYNEGSFSPRGKFKIKKTSEFIWEKEKEKMKNSPIKIHQTILLYWLIKKWKFENWEQFDSALKRELRPAKALNGYTLTEVRKAIAYCRNKFEDNWTLETIGKWIPEALKANSL